MCSSSSVSMWIIRLLVLILNIKMATSVGQYCEKESSYFSVSILRDQKVLKKELRLVPLEQTLAELAIAVNIDDKAVVVTAAESEIGDGTRVNDLNTPVSIINRFGWHYIKFYVKTHDISNKASTSVNNKRNAFTVLLANSVQKVLPPEKSDERADFRSYNHVLKVMRDHSVGFLPCQEDLSARILNTISGALWYMDPQYLKLISRGYELNGMFAAIHGYFDAKASKKAVPRVAEQGVPRTPKTAIAQEMLHISTNQLLVDATMLKKHIDDLSDLTMIPWMAKYKELQESVSQLVGFYSKYWKFLTAQQDRDKKHHEAEECLRNTESNFCLRTIPASTEVIKECYKELESAITKDNANYCLVDLSDFVPESRYDRRLWLQHLQFSVPVQQYTYYQGNYLGNINFLWKIPVDLKLRSDEEVCKIVTQIHKSITLYATRCMRKQFFDRYIAKTKLQPAVLRDMYSYLSGNSSAPESSEQAAIDARMETFLATDDPEIILDLRKLNGNPGSTKYTIFWEALDDYFNEQILAVQERRHGDHMYMPFSISTESLVQTIVKRVPEGTPIPSAEWVRLQFWPTNPTTKRAIMNTGRYNIKFKLQCRQIRGKHEDTEYVLKQITYLKEFAVKWSEYAIFFWEDDKAIIPIGEPERPVGTGVRPQNRSLAPVFGPVRLSALDHDFHVAGCVPTAIFKSDIPERASDSFFQGDIYVAVKDKIFQPSHGIRHGAELMSLIRTHYSLDGVSADHPILLELTDGGPDHRTTYGSVQVTHIIKFIQLDLDLLVAARTPPMGSWANLAERVMSLLNLALQNVALQRAPMHEDMEKIMSRVSTLKEARDKAARNATFKESLFSSVQPVIELLKQRFLQLKLKDVPVQIHPAADDDEITEFFNALGIIDGEINDRSKLTQKDLKKSTRLTDFMDRHCRLRQYTFQIKKCDMDACDDCWYCILKPPRLPEEIYSNLNFLPDPVMNADTGTFKTFDSVYGTTTTDSSRPSLHSAQDKVNAVDQINKSVLVAAKVRSYINCGECDKPRCIYSPGILRQAEQLALTRVKASLMYTCGSPLFPEASAYVKTIIVRQGIKCISGIETQYYSAKCVKFPDVCFHCGSSEDHVMASDLHNFYKDYTTVRPICTACMSMGREPSVYGQINVGKRQKRK